MMMEMTAAKMGRLIKKSEMCMELSGLLVGLGAAGMLVGGGRGGLRGSDWGGNIVGGGRGNGGGRNYRAGANALEAVDDDDVARMKAFANDAETIGDGAGLHGTILEGVFLAEDENIFLVEVGDNGGVVREAAHVRAGTLEANANEEAGSEGKIFVGEGGANADGAGGGADLIINEGNATDVGEIVFVGESEKGDAAERVGSGVGRF